MPPCPSISRVEDFLAGLIAAFFGGFPESKVRGETGHHHADSRVAAGARSRWIQHGERCRGVSVQRSRNGVRGR